MTARERARRLLRRSHEDHDTIDLTSADYAWWARPDPAVTPLTEPLRGIPTDALSRARWSAPPGPSTEPAEQPPGAPAAGEEADAYAVLGVDELATWDEITVAHRNLAKAHHPDALTSATPAQREEAEEAIRRLNSAYAELRLRRGKV